MTFYLSKLDCDLAYYMCDVMDPMVYLRHRWKARDRSYMILRSSGVSVTSAIMLSRDL